MSFNLLLILLFALLLLGLLPSFTRSRDWGRIPTGVLTFLVVVGLLAVIAF